MSTITMTLQVDLDDDATDPDIDARDSWVLGRMGEFPQSVFGLFDSGITVTASATSTLTGHHDLTPEGGLGAAAEAPGHGR